MSEQNNTLSYFKLEKEEEIVNPNFKTVPDYLHHYHDTQPEKEAFVFAFTDGSREAVTYKDLYINSLHVAKCLIKLGVKKHEFVAVSMRNSSKWLYAAFGAVLAGARPVSMSFTYTDGSDVIAMMQKLETCSLLFLDPGAKEENWNIFKKLAQKHGKNGSVLSEKMPYLSYLICHDRPKDTDQVLTLRELMTWETPAVTLPELFPEDIFTLFQTSGSTGVPKAIAHTHKSFISAAFQWKHVIGGMDEIHFNDRYGKIVWARSCENVSYAICEQQRCRSACASAQSDQHLCCSLPR